MPCGPTRCTLYTAVARPGSPQPFYEGLGFVPTGEVDSHGEVHLALDLTGRDAGDARLLHTPFIDDGRIACP